MASDFHIIRETAVALLTLVMDESDSSTAEMYYLLGQMSPDQSRRVAVVIANWFVNINDMRFGRDATASLISRIGLGSALMHEAGD